MGSWNSSLPRVAHWRWRRGHRWLGRAIAAPPGFSGFQQRLLGPVYSNPCPFTADLKPDDAAQKKGIAGVRHGIGVFAATAGNTKYSTLGFDEIKHVNRVMIECVSGKR